ncbi:MAG: FecR domain-containing protein [Deltaproteobacteria bacterium]
MKMCIQVLGLIVSLATSLHAAEIGRIKTISGVVSVDHAGSTVRPSVGTPVHENDILRTGANGSAGVIFEDNSLLSIGPNSKLSLDKFSFNTTTHKGVFEAKLKKGTLAGVSGKINKETPEAMKIRTPAAILGMRGTEFLVLVEGEVEP